MCSPGLWPPERTFPPTGLAERMHNAIQQELSELDVHYKDGLVRLMGDLASSRVKENPLPEEATARLREYLVAHGMRAA